MLVAPRSPPPAHTSLTSLAAPLGRNNATRYNTHVPANTDVELPSAVIMRGRPNLRSQFTLLLCCHDRLVAPNLVEIE